ncbi:MAG: hypothetical protein DMD96_10790 [Candidatus Rokuibacteriota bacterium]|nr:MAG: hypothetical protein DMD96_10790 [Candidatus Rokubacteria bacterium]
MATPRAISPDGIEGDVKAAQRGDLDAYGRIFVRFQDIAFAVALARLREPAVAQDVAQEAFIEALMSLERLAEPAAFPGWFRTIVERQASRVLRSRRPTAGSSPPEAPTPVDDGPERSAEVAEFNSPNRFGKTPLHRAVQRGAIGIVESLRAAGADASRQDREGHTALDLARRQSDPPIIAALSRAVAR